MMGKINFELFAERKNQKHIINSEKCQAVPFTEENFAIFLICNGIYRSFWHFQLLDYFHEIYIATLEYCEIALTEN